MSRCRNITPLKYSKARSIYYTRHEATVVNRVVNSVVNSGWVGEAVK